MLGDRHSLGCWVSAIRVNDADGIHSVGRWELMNKAKVAKLAVKTATRYPKPTVRGAKFVVRHRKGLLQSVRTSRKASQGSQRLIARASDPGFREEVAAAMSALGVAAKRAQKMGGTSAVEDTRVRELIRQAA
jgi:Holliday junction resolvasome RuvABC DNA-binding subunit